MHDKPSTNCLSSSHLWFGHHSWSVLTFHAQQPAGNWEGHFSVFAQILDSRVYIQRYFNTTVEFIILCWNMRLLNSLKLYIAVNNSVPLRRKKPKPKLSGGCIPLINDNTNLSNVTIRSILNIDNQLSNEIKMKGNLKNITVAISYLFKTWKECEKNVFWSWTIP